MTGQQLPWNKPGEHLEPQPVLRGTWIIERFTEAGRWVGILASPDESYARRMYKRAACASSRSAVRLRDPQMQVVAQLSMPFRRPVAL